jgi:hypothetical protein
MFGIYLSPLAPAVTLLLGALILFIILPRLPDTWQAGPAVKYLNAPVWIGITLTTLLFIPYTPDRLGLSSTPAVLSGWSFSTADSLALLTVRADPIGLPFLIITLLVLLAVSLLTYPWKSADIPESENGTLWGWFLMASVACALFVSANGLTLIHSIMVFDGVVAAVWISYRRQGVAVARLFLAMVTVTGLTLFSAIVDQSQAVGMLFVGLSLWLRLALYPLLDTLFFRSWRGSDRLAYLSLTLLVGSYISLRIVSRPLPDTILMLTLFTMMVSGVLAWITLGQSRVISRQNMLNWLLLAEIQLVLLLSPVAPSVVITFTAGLILSIVALWVTPALGRPKLAESAWSWPYLPALFATITLFGLPFSLGWPLRYAVLQALSEQSMILAVGVALFLAEVLALSSLPQYWRILWQGQDQNGRQLLVGIVAMVPFLAPVLGLFILSELTKLPVDAPVNKLGPWLYVAGLIGGAFLARHFQPAIIARLFNRPNPANHDASAEAGLGPSLQRDETGVLLANLGPLVSRLSLWLDDAGRFVLRAQVVLEGQHYVGWAIFVALLGALIILLN